MPKTEPINRGLQVTDGVVDLNEMARQLSRALPGGCQVAFRAGDNELSIDDALQQRLDKLVEDAKGDAPADGITSTHIKMIPAVRRLVDHMKSRAGLNIADLFVRGVCLQAAIMEARAKGLYVCIADEQRFLIPPQHEPGIGRRITKVADPEN